MAGIVYVLLCICGVVIATERSQKYIQMKNSFNLLDNYNKQIRPQEGLYQDIVQVGIFINRVRSVSETDMSLVLDVFLQAQWHDRRLIPSWNKLYHDIYNISKEQCTQPVCNETVFTMGAEFASWLWRPDFYISSAVRISIADDINDNTCIRFRNDGEIFYSNRVILTVSCIMQLIFFPFDSHQCDVCLGSYKYHDGLLKMVWDKGIAGIYPNQNTANFHIDDKLDNYNDTTLYMGDNFTLHCFSISIHRKSKIFLVTLYLPSISLVMLSWVNFWVDPKAIPARAGLSITAILAQITLIVGMASRFPSVSDLKVADLYVTINFIFTFAALIEFAVVSYTPPPANESLVISQPLYKSLNGSSTKETIMDENGFNTVHHKKLPSKKKRTYTVDDISRVMFPGVFLLWNFAFFSLNFYYAGKI